MSHHESTLQRVRAQVPLIARTSCSALPAVGQLLSATDASLFRVNCVVAATACRAGPALMRVTNTDRVYVPVISVVQLRVPAATVSKQATCGQGE